MWGYCWRGFGGHLRLLGGGIWTRILNGNTTSKKTNKETRNFVLNPLTNPYISPFFRSGLIP